VRLLLLIGALLAELVAAVTLLDVWQLVDERHALGCVALGLALYLLAVQPLGAPPRS